MIFAYVIGQKFIEFVRSRHTGACSVLENSIDNPEYSLKSEIPALYLNLSDSNIFEIPFLSIMHFGSSVSITQGDTIRINPRSFVKAPGKQPPLPVFENLSGCEDADTGPLSAPEGETIPRCPDDFI